jgi:hypothetical protein
MRTPALLICAATAALYFFIPLMNAELIGLIAREDQLVEWTGALAYLGASIVALLAFVASATAAAHTTFLRSPSLEV